MQKLDAFDDIRGFKQEVLMRGDVKYSNKIMIEDFAPKEIVPGNKHSGKRKWGGKSFKSSQTGD